MNFLKKLFGGSSGDGGLYFYVRPKACKEVVKIRVHIGNDLSLMDDDEGYFTRKFARGNRCPFTSEIELFFDKRRQLINKEIKDGEFVTEADYEAWLSEQAAS